MLLYITLRIKYNGAARCLTIRARHRQQPLPAICQPDLKLHLMRCQLWRRVRAPIRRTYRLLLLITICLLISRFHMNILLIPLHWRQRYRTGQGYMVMLTLISRQHILVSSITKMSVWWLVMVAIRRQLRQRVMWVRMLSSRQAQRHRTMCSSMRTAHLQWTKHLSLWRPMTKRFHTVVQYQPLTQIMKVWKTMKDNPFGQHNQQFQQRRHQQLR